MVVAASPKLSQRTTRLRTSATPRSRWHAENAPGAPSSPAQTWLQFHGVDHPLPTLLDHLAAPGCQRVGNQGERCGVYYLNPID